MLLVIFQLLQTQSCTQNNHGNTGVLFVYSFCARTQGSAVAFRNGLYRVAGAMQAWWMGLQEKYLPPSLI